MDIVRRSNQNAEDKLKNKDESEGDYLAPLEEAPRKKVSQEHLLYKVQENQSKKRKRGVHFVMAHLLYINVICRCWLH